MMTARGATAAGGGGPRPMTSAKGAGYSSKPPGPAGGLRALDPSAQKSAGPAPPLSEKADNTPEDLARDMEKKVNAVSFKSI